jgi:hypothetical protein
LQQNGGGELARDAVGNGKRTVGVHDNLLRVAALCARPGDHLVTGASRAFDTGDERRLSAVASFPLVHVSVVDADRLDVDEQLIRTGLGRRHILQLEYLRAAAARDDDGAHAA